MDTKECHRCFERKSTLEFHRCSRRPDGLQTWCKVCINQYKRRWRTKNRTTKQKKEHERQEENRHLAKQNLKRCSECWEVKPLSEFWRGSRGVLTGTRGRCSECQQAWNSANRPSRPSPPSLQKKAIKAIFDEIQRGNITKPSACSFCGSSPPTRKRGVSRIQFHHTNGYVGKNKFVGAFVCARCHREIHLGRIEIEGRVFYEYHENN